MRFLFDTNVIIGYLGGMRIDEDSEAAVRKRSSCRSRNRLSSGSRKEYGDPQASEDSLLSVLNTKRRSAFVSYVTRLELVKPGEETRQVIESQLEEFDKLCDGKVKLLSLSPRIQHTAYEILRTAGIPETLGPSRTSDALAIATGVFWNMILVTGDRAWLQVARKMSKKSPFKY